MEIKETLLCGIAVGEEEWVENKSDCHLPCSRTNGFDRADTHKPTQREAMNLQLSNVLLSVLLTCLKDQII